jgi:hypothetical protein
MYRRSVALALLMTTMAVCPALVSAAEPEVIGDRIVVRGHVAEELSGLLRLNALEATDVFLLPGPLEHVDPDPENALPAIPDPSEAGVPAASCRIVGRCLDASSVVVTPPSAKLEAGVPTDFAIAIPKVDRPGIYQGAVEVRYRRSAAPSAQPALETTAKFVTLTLVVSHVPGLSLLGDAESVDLRHARLTNALDQFLAPFFLDPIEMKGRLAIPVANIASTTVVLSGGNVVLVGERSGQLLSPAEVSIPELQTTPRRVGPDAQLPLTLRLNAADVVPDRYRGTIYLRFEGIAAPQAIPVELDVRRGPLGPLLLIIVGVVLGLFVRAMASRGDPLLAVADRLDVLRARIATARLSPGDQLALTGLADRALRQIEFGRVADAEISIDGVETGTTILEDTTELGASDAPEAKRIRRYVYLRDNENATLVLKAWRKAIGETDVFSGPPPEIAIPPAPPRAGRVRPLLATGGLAVASVAVVFVSLTLARLDPVGAGNPGLADDPTTTAYWILLTLSVAFLCLLYVVHRPLLRRVPPRHRLRLLRAGRLAVQGLTAVALVLVGMKLLYAEDALSFIGPTAASVLPFILWGIGTDFSSRSVAGLVTKG